MFDETSRQQHAIQHQLLAVRLGALYGALAFAGLIATHLVAGGQDGARGAFLAILGAGLAYVNFTLVVAQAKGHWINASMAASILAGVLSALLLPVF